MQTSAAGRAAIMQREGCILKAYKDSVGVLTIGVGHTGRASPPTVTAGMTITKTQADAMLANDLVEFERAVNAVVKVAITQAEFDALVSLAFNIGAAGFAGSTVVRRLNAGDVRGAGHAFLMWNKPPELLGRRRSERAQFLGQALEPVAPKPSAAKAGAAAAATVVVAGGAGAIATGGHPAAIAVALLAAAAAGVGLVFLLRKKA